MLNRIRKKVYARGHRPKPGSVWFSPSLDLLYKVQDSRWVKSFAEGYGADSTEKSAGGEWKVMENGGMIYVPPEGWTYTAFGAATGTGYQPRHAAPESDS